MHDNLRRDWAWGDVGVAGSGRESSAGCCSTGRDLRLCSVSKEEGEGEEYVVGDSSCGVCRVIVVNHYLALSESVVCADTVNVSITLGYSGRSRPGSDPLVENKCACGRDCSACSARSYTGAEEDPFRRVPEIVCSRALSAGCDVDEHDTSIRVHNGSQCGSRAVDEAVTRPGVCGVAVEASGVRSSTCIGNRMINLDRGHVSGRDD